MSLFYSPELDIKDFANMSKLRILGWGAYPGLFKSAKYNHECPYKREGGGAE